MPDYVKQVMVGLCVSEDCLRAPFTDTNGERWMLLNLHFVLILAAVIMFLCCVIVLHHHFGLRISKR